MYPANHRFNTGNAIQSEALKDASDNLKDLELCMLSDLPTYKNRLGKTRPTMAFAASNALAGAPLYPTITTGRNAVEIGGYFSVYTASGIVTVYKKLTSSTHEKISDNIVTNDKLAAAELSDDWDAVVISGRYRGPTTATDFPGKPPQLMSSSSISLIHEEAGWAGRATQIATAPVLGDGQIMVVRMRSGGVWRGWIPVLLDKVGTESIEDLSITNDKLAAAELSDDWDAVVISGRYRGPTTATDFPGKPPQLMSSSSISLIHEEAGWAGRATQIATAPVLGGGQIMVVRMRSGGVWRGWIPVLLDKVGTESIEDLSITNDKYADESISFGKLEKGLLGSYSEALAARRAGAAIDFSRGAPASANGFSVTYENSALSESGAARWIGGPEESKVTVLGPLIEPEDSTAIISASVLAGENPDGVGAQVLQQTGTGRIDFNIDLVRVSNRVGYGNFYHYSHHPFRYQQDVPFVMSMLFDGSKYYCMKNDTLVAHGAQSSVIKTGSTTLLGGSTAIRRKNARISSAVFLNSNCDSRGLGAVIASQMTSTGVRAGAVRYCGLLETELDSSYCAIDSGGVVLAESGSEIRESPASVAKIATLLVGLDNIALSAELTVIAADISQDSLLAAGDKISMRDACLAAMMLSSNTSANVIARYTGDAIDGGGVSTCARVMTAMLRAAGATDTKFVNGSGLYNAGQYTNARDMALLGSLALKNYTLADLMSRTAETIKINNTPQAISTTVTNIGESGVFGGKTGTISSPSVGTYNLLNFVSYAGGTYAICCLQASSAITRFNVANNVIDGIKIHKELFG